MDCTVDCTRSTHGQQHLGGTTHPPFAALPHDLRKDPRLKGNRTAVVLAAALLEYAPGHKPYCYPTNARLCADLDCCETTVRTALAALQRTGWIRIDLGSQQPNGRKIWLTWRLPGGMPGGMPADRPVPGTEAPAPRTRASVTGVPGPHASMHVPGIRQVCDTPQPAGPSPRPADPPPQPAGSTPRPAGPEEERSEEREERYVTRPNSHPIPTPALAVPAATQQSSQPARGAVPGMPAAQAPSVPAKPLPDELRALPGADPDRVRRVACRLAAWLADPGSLGYYLSVLAKVAAGGDPDALERLMAAYRAGTRAKGSARRAGAIFAWTHANWVRPPRPSEIRYYQTPTTQCANSAPPSLATVTPGEPVAEPPPPMDREAEIRELRIMAGDARHPFQRVAQARLVELGVELGANLQGVDSPK